MDAALVKGRFAHASDVDCSLVVTTASGTRYVFTPRQGSDPGWLYSRIPVGDDELGHRTAIAVPSVGYDGERLFVDGLVSTHIVDVEVLGDGPRLRFVPGGGV